MKKIISLVLAFCCVFSLNIVSFATEKNDDLIFYKGDWYTQEDIAHSEEVFNFYYNEGLEILNGIQTRAPIHDYYALSVPRYFQNDLTWSNTQMPCGDSGDTYGKKGCMMTAYAMVLKYYGYNVNPVSVATTYQNNHGKCCEASSSTLLSDYGHTREKVPVSDKYFSDISTAIAGALDNDKPVVIKLNPTSAGDHFVVAYGYNVLANGTINISIRDPWSVNGTDQYSTLKAAYNAGRTAVSIFIVS